MGKLSCVLLDCISRKLAERACAPEITAVCGARSFSRPSCGGLIYQQVVQSIQSAITLKKILE